MSTSPPAWRASRRQALRLLAAGLAPTVLPVVAATVTGHRTLVAAYYELKLALHQGRVIEWGIGAPPRVVLRDALQVAVGRSRGYAIDGQLRLLSWVGGTQRIETWTEQAAWVAAGDSGVFVIRSDGGLWHRGARDGAAWHRMAGTAEHAWVGDGADYYITPAGQLFVRGLAHRGQYGDGRLTEAPGWSPVADAARMVVAHTGHALYLRRDGVVLGTGGNRFGPLGRHGIGDKADRWGPVFDKAVAIATGSRHSLALRADGSLWIWGAQEGLDPRPVLQGVTAMAGGLDDSVALDTDGALWHWQLGRAPARLLLPTS